MVKEENRRDSQKGNLFGFVGKPENCLLEFESSVVEVELALPKANGQMPPT